MCVCDLWPLVFAQSSYTWDNRRVTIILRASKVYRNPGGLIHEFDHGNLLGDMWPPKSAIYSLQGMLQLDAV